MQPQYLQQAGTRGQKWEVQFTCAPVTRTTWSGYVGLPAVPRPGDLTPAPRLGSKQEPGSPGGTPDSGGTLARVGARITRSYRSPARLGRISTHRSPAS